MSALPTQARQTRIRACHDVMPSDRILKAREDLCSLNGERTPLPGQLRLSGRQGCVRPPISVPLRILSDDAKKPVRFVGDSSREKDSGRLREKIPQAIELEWRSIGAHERLDKSLRSSRIVNVNEAVTEIADPEFTVNESKSPWRIEIPV